MAKFSPASFPSESFSAPPLWAYSCLLLRDTKCEKPTKNVPNRKRGDRGVPPLDTEITRSYCSALSVLLAVAVGLKRITPDSSTKKWRVPEDVV